MTTPDLPEGVDAQFVRQHAANLGIVAALINAYGTHQETEAGTPEEAQAEQALDEHIEHLIGLGPETCGEVIICLLAVIEATSDEERAQAWFDHNAARIKEVLGV
jgi:hypothetical protein